MNPFFSVVVPVYNRESLITRCIDSIFNQDFENWELVIVDDGSTDETRNVILSYDDERIRYIYKENGGASSARNVALDNSNGTYIAFLDSDDEYKPDHLSAIFKFLEDNNFPVCFVCTDFIMNYGGRIVHRETSKFLTTKPNFTNLPYTQATAIHKDAIGHDRFNEDLIIREDAEFLDRIRNKVDCYRVKNKSVILHRHDDSITGNSIFVKKEMEKSIYYYIRTRKRVTMKELSKLYEIYTILSLHYFRKKKSGKILTYVTKMMLLSPVCLFHYPSLKATYNRMIKLLRQN
jgi:glycosyltransferase involved in cell wall biosynthesis